MSKTTIPCDTSTRDRLKKLGRKDEDWNALLNRAADNFSLEDRVKKLENTVSFLERLIHVHLSLGEMSLDEAWCTGAILCHDIKDYDKEECVWK